jgi:hypothetical protein
VELYSLALMATSVDLGSTFTIDVDRATKETGTVLLESDEGIRWRNVYGRFVSFAAEG